LDENKRISGRRQRTRRITDKLHDRLVEEERQLYDRLLYSRYLDADRRAHARRTGADRRQGV